MKFPSKYTDKEITAAQLLCDKVGEALARQNKTTLPNFWWDLPKYKKFFTRQIVQANALLKLFKLEDILKALNEMSWCYTLSQPKLIEKISELSKKVEEAPTKLEIGSIEETPREKIKGGLLDKL